LLGFYIDCVPGDVVIFTINGGIYRISWRGEGGRLTGDRFWWVREGQARFALVENGHRIKQAVKGTGGFLHPTGRS
jgi:hypothetical protein